jgi:anti-anti-sigma regulatory factor
MVLHIRRVGDDSVVLSNLARLMNDPRYTSAGDVIGEEIAAGRSRWVLELADVRDAGAPFLGVLMTLTRRIRQAGAEVVLAHVSRPLEHALQEMQLDDFWDSYGSVEEALGSFNEGPISDEDR